MCRRLTRKDVKHVGKTGNVGDTYEGSVNIDVLSVNNDGKISLEQDVWIDANIFREKDICYSDTLENTVLYTRADMDYYKLVIATIDHRLEWLEQRRKKLQQKADLSQPASNDKDSNKVFVSDIVKHINVLERKRERY